MKVHIASIDSLLFGVWKIKDIKIISKGNVMCIKASDICTEAFLHNAVSKLSTNQLVSRIGAKNDEENRKAATSFCKWRKSRAHQDYQQGRCDVNQSV